MDNVYELYPFAIYSYHYVVVFEIYWDADTDTSPFQQSLSLSRQNTDTDLI